MASKGAGALFAVAIVAAVGGVGLMLWQSGRPGTPPPAPPAPPPPVAKQVQDPVQPPPTPGKKKPAKPPEPPEPPIPSNPEGCLAFLRAQAGTATPPEGRISMVPFDDVRCAALDALVALDPKAAEPLVLQALGGDGDVSEWSSWRLHAAEIRIRAGQPDGAATVRAFGALDAESRPSDGIAAAARAASWMTAEEGGAVLHRLLAVGVDAFDDDEDLVAVLQAAATLGKGATTAELRKLFVEEAAFDATVLGAGAGALFRLGDDSGKKALDRIEQDDDWVAEGAEFAQGLGARGNESAIPSLSKIRGVEDEWSRAGAVRALAAIGTPAVVPLLRESLKDADPDVQAEAAVSLALRGEKDVLPLVRKAVTSQHDEIAVRAWRALALLQDAASKEAAEKLLGEPSPGLRDVRRGGALLRRIEAALLILRVSK